MRIALMLGCVALFAACASVPTAPSADGLFRDALFAPPSTAIDPDAAMAASAEMRSYLGERITGRTPVADRKRQLIDALYRKGDLRLEYDAALTRTAAQAFDARSGNCLSLVMMTGAFARELGLTVQYQVFPGNDLWDRTDDIYIAVGHVNLTLGDRPPLSSAGFARYGETMTVDFIAPSSGQAVRARVVQEHTIVAMYLNNRAVESLTHGQVDDAYWWAREALRQDPTLLSAYITLGVVYRNRHQPELADAALQRVLVREPENTMAMSNRVLVLRDLGRAGEAATLAQQLDRLDPHPPFSYFHEGRVALREGRLDDARALFAKEVERAPHQHESQFWLAVTYLALHDTGQATVHLTRAMEESTTRKDHDLYAAKLDRLKALGLQ